VLNGLTGVLGTTDEDSVGTSGGTESQLIQGQDFTTGLQDTGLGGLGEVESSNGDLGEVQKTGVIGDGTDNNNSLVTLKIADNTGDGDGRTVDTGHKETLQDNLVEVGVSTTSQETVKLDYKMCVKINISLFFVNTIYVACFLSIYRDNFITLTNKAK
jgi:hypothetical protein